MTKNAEVNSGADRRSAASNGSAWLPIETAPKDGTSILLHNNDAPGCPGGVADKCWCGNTAVAEWWEDAADWVCYMSMVKDPELHFRPTHWMPLPQPPNTKLSDGGTTTL